MCSDSGGLPEAKLGVEYVMKGESGVEERDEKTG